MMSEPERLSSLLPSVVAEIARHQLRQENEVINSAPYYWITCDGCGANGQEGSDHSAWKEADTAFIEPDAAGWTEDGDKHWCEKCTFKREAAADESPVLPSGGTET